MLKKLDQSRRLSRFLNWLSNALAQKRGLPVLLGLGLIILGFMCELLGLLAANRLLDLAALLAHNLGVLIAIGGLLLATPLGK